MEVREQAWQMETAFEEKAEVNVIRGPNSKDKLLLEAALNALSSSRNLIFSNVSARSHSSLDD